MIRKEKWMKRGGEKKTERLTEVFRNYFKMILETKEYKELHKNGSVWITGTIAIVADPWKHLYSLIGFPGFEKIHTCRIGKWSKYYSNGQLAWTIEYDDFGYAKPSNYPSFRIDGTEINY